MSNSAILMGYNSGCRCIVVANHLPVRVSKSEADGSWEIERDEDSLIAHVQVSIPA